MQHVALFRKQRDADEAVAADDPTAPSDAALAPRPEQGPFDVGEVPDRGDRLDVGALWLPHREGMELRMEVDKNTKVVTGASMQLHGSALQVQVFAAPRTDGIWDEIRAEIAESVTKQGGSVDDLPGPFGRELLARLPVRTAEGRTGHRPARFIGHDGPRWFLRGVLSGRAAVDPERARELEALFADVVVVRGSEPRVPRDLLPLTLPGQVPLESGSTSPTFDPMKRGPEITEVH
jgi:hypothetical protein